MMWRSVSQLCAVAVQILANYFSFRKSRFPWPGMFCSVQCCLHCASRLPEMSIFSNTTSKSAFIFEFVFEGRKVVHFHPPAICRGGTNDVLVLCGLHSLSHTHPSACEDSSWRLWQYLHFSIWLNAVLSCPSWTLIVPLSTTRSN